MCCPWQVVAEALLVPDVQRINEVGFNLAGMSKIIDIRRNGICYCRVYVRGDEGVLLPPWIWFTP